MTRTVFIYAALLAIVVFILEWIEFQYMARAFATEIYIILIGIGFTILGIWLGRALTPRTAPEAFALNAAALQSLGITKREHAVLQHLADGQSNKDIAQNLHISPNTVKTHISRLYEKLEVNQRIQAIQKARDLRLIP